MANHERLFQERVSAALAARDERRNFGSHMAELRRRRRLSLAELHDSDGMRRICEAIRRESLKQLPENLELFESSLQGNGVHVHWAASSKDAQQLIGEIAQSNGVESIVKAKSLTCEEIGLRDFLNTAGIELTETDLGDWIVQLAGQKAAHIVLPAIHLDREQIGKLFAEKLGCKTTSDPEELIAIARLKIRNKIEQAGMGITGVNFGVAESGTLVIVENEGNARLVSTLPPIHVAVMGIDKVVGRLSEVPPLLRMLTRSATGQPITSFVQWINSPRDHKEPFGPKSLHLILLDNGRSQIYPDDELRETLKCIRCGSCLNHCPVYSRIGGEAYGVTYTGPIGKILSPQIYGYNKAGHLPFASTLCGSCAEVCPVEIPIPQLLLRLRQDVVDSRLNDNPERRPNHLHRLEAIFWHTWQHIFQKGQRFTTLRRLFRIFGFPPLRPLRSWRKGRDLPKMRCDDPKCTIRSRK